jgi:hypothetical protein
MYINIYAYICIIYIYSVGHATVVVTLMDLLPNAGVQRVKVTDSLTYSRFSGPGHLPKLLAKIMVTQNE